jgi:tubulin-folding cofactor B
MATAADIPLLIVSENSSSERRISPSWTIAQLKGRLEPVTGVPASCQRLSLKIGSQAAQPIEAADEESTILAAWPLQAYAEIKVGTILLLSSDVSYYAVSHGSELAFMQECEVTLYFPLSPSS